MVYPIKLDTIQIELADFCNLNCIMCDMSIEGRKRHGHLNPEQDIHSQKKQFLSFNTFKKIIDSINNSGIKVGILSLFWLGEPMINPYIDEMLSYLNTHSKNIDGWMIHTNGNVLRDSTVKIMCQSKKENILHFSIDAATEETYNKVRRGGNFKILIKNIRKVLDMKPNLRLILQFIVMQENYKEAGAFIEFWKKEFEKRNMEYAVACNYSQHKKNTIFLRQEIGRPDKQKELDELHDRVCKELNLLKE